MTPTARPRFRTDLVAEPVEEGGHRYIDVVDPDTGSGFRFYDVEYSLACAMDGERDVPGLVQWAKEELGIEPSPKELATVISTLGDLGYLDVATTAPAHTTTQYEAELAVGVIAAPRGAGAPPVDDVELGHMAASRSSDEVIPTGDFELGVAGGTAPAHVAAAAYDTGPELGPPGGREAQREIVMEFEAPTPPPAEMPHATMRPSTRPDAEDDGPTNLPNPATTADFDDDEVSVDLSDHLAISASDVKEAVRASKVMKAVDLPPELAAQLESSDQAAAASREAAERAAAERAAAERAAAERAAAERAAAEVARPASVELPRPPVGVSRPKQTTERPADKPAVVPAPEAAMAPARRGTSTALVILLLLVVLAAAAFFVWTRVLKKPLPWETATDSTATKTGTGPGTAGAGTGSAPQPPPPPPPPPPPSAMLAERAGTPTDVAASAAGVVASVAAEGAAVAAGDELVRLAGNPAWEGKLKGLDYDIDQRVPKQLADAAKARDKYTAAGNAAAAKAQEAVIVERQKRLDEKKAERDKIRALADALSIKAPVAGTVAIKVGKGARVAAAQAVATVTPAAVLTATFTLPATAKPLSADASVRIAVKATPEQKANCTVGAVAGAEVTVVCLLDSGIAAGTEVVLE